MKLKPHKNKKRSGKAKLILAMSSIIFTLFYVSAMAFWLIYMIFYKLPFIDVERLPQHTNFYIYCGLSLILGFILSMIFHAYVLVPLRNSYAELNKMAEGNFDVNIDEKGIRPVRNITKSINATAKELNNLGSVQSDFISNFSHEFRTPIVSISGFAKMLRDTELSEVEKKEYLDIIIDESQRLAQLSTNVLNLTKLDNQNVLTDVSNFNVTEQLRRTIILLAQKWTSKNITINFDSDECQIEANEELLSQLWINLIDNAIKFSPENSEITIDIFKKGRNICFTFTDEGEGMDATTVKHAFDRFFHGDSSHKSMGYGIGLAISKRICELHNGSINIKSTDKTGSTFEVIIPEKFSELHG